MFALIKNFFNSIALVPSGLALTFLLFAILLSNIPIHYEDIAFFKYVSITDKTDSQFVLSFIIGGIFTLTVFSYTMVMNVLNRNINNYSPRLIPLLLSQKHHQIILGFTSGTIIYAMVMSLSLINSSRDYFPSIAGGIGIIFSITSVLLFIYFLHTVSQSVHINHILKSVYKLTLDNILILKKDLASFEVVENTKTYNHVVTAPHCGYLRYPNYTKISNLLNRNNLQVSFLKIPGEFIYEGDPLYALQKEPTAKQEKEINKLLAIDEEVALDVLETGLKHLVEVVIKGCSPAINDPGTSMAALQYFTQLILKRMDNLPYKITTILFNNLLSLKILGLREIVHTSFVEIYKYGHTDPLLIEEIKASLIKINKKAAFEHPIVINDFSKSLS